MAHEKPEHDYHLVEPSFWPFIAAMGALVMALGGVMYLEGGSSFLFFIGLLIILYVMFGWFSDIVRESKAGYHTTIVKLGLRYGVFMFIASEVMFFVAWFWAFFDASLFYNSAEMPVRAAVRTVARRPGAHREIDRPASAVSFASATASFGPGVAAAPLSAFRFSAFR